MKYRRYYQRVLKDRLTALRKVRYPAFMCSSVRLVVERHNDDISIPSVPFRRTTLSFFLIWGENENLDHRRRLPVFLCHASPDTTLENLESSLLPCYLHRIFSVLHVRVLFFRQRELADARKQRFAHQNAIHVAKVRQVSPCVFPDQLCDPFPCPAETAPKSRGTYPTKSGC